MSTSALSYRQHRYPAAIIAHCVRLYFRFPLSYRGVEELMFERGVVVSYETIRRWCHKVCVNEAGARGGDKRILG